MNLLSSIVELIARVRLLSRCTTVETRGGWWEESTHVGNHWVRKKPERVSNWAEQGKCWVSGMFTPDHKIIPHYKIYSLINSSTRYQLF